MRKNILPIAVLIAGILVAGTALYVNRDTGVTLGVLLTVEEASDKVIEFVNSNILQGRSTASLIEATEESGIYNIKFSIEGQEINSYVTADGKLFFPEAIEITESIEVAVSEGLTIGSFFVSNDTVCEEDGKPIVYFFGSETCPYCRWEHPVVEKVMEKFGDTVAFHDNMDVEADQDVFAKYSAGGIPTMVIGCKYYRVGAGQEDGEEVEIDNLTALTCKLTGNQPEEVCNEVQELINQI